MHNACSFGHSEVVSTLLKHGANPNARDNWNFTPLHEAAIKDKVDVCISKFGSVFLLLCYTYTCRHAQIVWSVYILLWRVILFILFYLVCVYK